jgi:DNA-binding beta-propeller fold protein YncE
MLDQIISKNSSFVILFVFLALSIAGCNITASQTGSQSKKKHNLSEDFLDAEEIARIDSADVSESSGLEVSKCNPGVFWTHNDSGNGNKLFAFNEKGADLGTWRVTGAANKDWEDISSFKDKQGKCHLFIGDIGNNSLGRRELTIYKILEPIVKPSAAVLSTETAIAIKFEYPDSRHDAEALAVHPESGAIYVVTKRYGGASGVYEVIPGTKKARKIANVKVPSIPNGLVTGADVSSDGRHLVLSDYFGGYEFSLPADSDSFGDIWKQKPTLVDLGVRKQGEAVAYGPDGLTVYATSEKRDSPLFRARRRE